MAGRLRAAALRGDLQCRRPVPEGGIWRRVNSGGARLDPPPAVPFALLECHLGQPGGDFGRFRDNESAAESEMHQVRRGREAEYPDVWGLLLAVRPDAPAGEGVRRIYDRSCGKAAGNHRAGGRNGDPDNTSYG